jgi:cytidyltransferase-like protein
MEIKMTDTIVIASGYFDPIHKGHIEYLERSKKLGSRLVVIVNNDKQTMAKKEFVFMKCNERLRIIGKLAFVDEVIKSIDDDHSVCKTIRAITKTYKGCKFIFAKGGDRVLSNIPEVDVCKKNKVSIVEGLGKKIQSSSKLLGCAGKKIDKPWGNFKTFVENKKVTVKILTINKGEEISLQSHNHREEHWYVLGGSVKIQAGHSAKTRIYRKGDSVIIPQKTLHRITAISNGRILEISYGKFSENDILRREDKYGRLSKPQK